MDGNRNRRLSSVTSFLSDSSDPPTAQVSLYTFVEPVSISMMAPALPDIAERYNIKNPTIVAITLSIFLLSSAVGPLILAPLSEIYGRTWVCVDLSDCGQSQA